MSIVAEQCLGEGALKLLIEKDFECLDPRDGEDQSNRFRNPRRCTKQDTSMTELTHFSEAPFQLDNGLVGEPLGIATANPETFYQLISEPAAVPPATIRAQLFLPKRADGAPLPAVIMVPGSLGVGPNHLMHAVTLTDAGQAVCVIDPFGARGVASTVANQAQYSFAASAWDVLAAAQVLAAHAAIDADRIGAQGHSRGGSAVLNATCLSSLIPDTPRLSGGYAAYPLVWSAVSESADRRNAPAQHRW